MTGATPGGGTGDAPFLSVVIPTYCQPDLLTAALDSLARQDFPAGEAEIVVVDDGTPGFEPAQLALAPCPFAVQWQCRPANEGRARVRNRGVAAARGRVIVFLDGDMVAEAGFLAAHADFHRRHPGEIAIGAIAFGPQVARTAMTRYIHSRGVQGCAPGTPVPYKCFVTGNSSVERQRLERVGGFDETLSEYGGEDLELGLRLYRDGAVFRYADAARSLHGHARSFPEQLEAMATYGRTGMPHLVRRHPELAAVLRVAFLHRHTPAALAWRLLLSPLVYHPVRWLAGRLLWAPVPAVVFSYLWWSSRTRGYRRAPAGDRT